MKKLDEMSQRWVLWGIVFLAAAGCSSPQAPRAEAKPPILPLRSLRLYESGVGYFERSGSLNLQALNALPVPASHLDDALASLVVLSDPTRTSVDAISFRSQESQAVARWNAGFGSSANGKVSFRDILMSLRGEEVVLSDAGGAHRGRLVEVLGGEETSEVPRDGASLEVEGASAGDVGSPGTQGARGSTGMHAPQPKPLEVLLLAQDGSFSRMTVTSATTVRALDPSYAQRVTAMLDASGSRGAQQTRLLHLLGKSTGPITFGYVAEAPLWRASYRLVTTGTVSSLQGWALVHNDTDEDWQGIRLSLAHGEPDSFVFPMAAPRYNRRPFLHPDHPLSTFSQFREKTADEMWGDDPGDEEISLGGIGTSGGGMGYGTGNGRLSGIHASGEVMSDLLQVGDLASLAPATGVEAGAFFLFTAQQPFSLEAHSSSLVPFLQASLEVSPYVGFSCSSCTARSSMIVRNTLRQTLPAGTLSTFQDGGFAGESFLARLKPGERQFMELGNDLDVTLEEHPGSVLSEFEHVSYSHGSLRGHELKTTTETYLLHNRAGSARRVGVKLSVVRNSKVEGADGIEFDETKSEPWAMFQLPSGAKQERHVTLREGISHPLQATPRGLEELQKVMASPKLPTAEREILAEASQKIEEQQKKQRDLEHAEKERQESEHELERLRKDLEATHGDHAQGEHAALMKRVIDAEDRLSALQKQQDKLKDDVEGLEKATKETLARLPTDLPKQP